VYTLDYTPTILAGTRLKRNCTWGYENEKVEYQLNRAATVIGQTHF
jgi:hypothetical protein